MEDDVEIQVAKNKVKKRQKVPLSCLIQAARLKSAAVQRVQRAVKVNPDGIYGNQTTAAVRAYQKRQGWL